MVDEPATVCLFGEPRVALGDAAIPVRPPLAFQVLVALALNGGSLSRAEAAHLLFPALDPKGRRDQLRIVLSRLRAGLAQAGLSRLYQEEGEALRLAEGVGIDAWELLSGERLAPQRLGDYSRPVLAGCRSRFADACRGRAKNAVEASLPAILSGARSEGEMWSLLPALERLRSLYPHSATVCGCRVAALRRLSLYEEAAREIGEFDDDWIDAYGSHDRPDVDRIARGISLPADGREGFSHARQENET